MIIVTGGCGFIGSNFVLDWLQQSDETIINIDKLTYAGNVNNLASIAQHPQYQFIQGDINDTVLIENLLSKHQPRAVIHFAAESHVDRSISGPADFIQTNVVGTFHLLETVRHYWSALSGDKKNQFRFLHVSTDEVYGSLTPTENTFTESTAYQPNSPYAASKAASDHFVRAYHHTYGLPTLTTNCSNNYGPYQYPEKLIPLMILHALHGKPLPIYGNGKNVRDWLYVKDHCAAVRLVLEKGQCGETYNIGGNNEKTNIEIVETICDLLDEFRPKDKSYRLQMSFVPDRPGHDFRYAINAQKIQQELGWRPQENFTTGLRKTVEWYLNHLEWAKTIHLVHNIL